MLGIPPQLEFEVLKIVILLSTIADEYLKSY